MSSAEELLKPPLIVVEDVDQDSVEFFDIQPDSSREIALSQRKKAQELFSPDAEKLKREMESFFKLHKEWIENESTLSDEQKSLLMEDLEERSPHLLGQAGHFYKMLGNAAMAGFILSPREESVFRSAHDKMGEKTVDAYRQFLVFFEEMIAEIAGKLKTQGLSYAMQGPATLNPEMPKDVRELMEFILVSFESFRKSGLLSLPQKQSQKTESEMQDRMTVIGKYQTDELGGQQTQEAACYQMELAMIQNIYQDLRKQAEEDGLTEKLTELSSFFLLHLRDALAGQVMTVLDGESLLSEKGRSSFRTPLQRMEYHLGIINRSVRLLDVIEFQKNLFLCEPEKAEKAPAVLTA